MSKNFDDLLCEKGDVIDNAAYALAAALVGVDDPTGPDAEQTIPWDMAYIGEIVDAAEEILKRHGYETCHPFNTGDETPCYQTDECSTKNCPMKQD